MILGIVASSTKESAVTPLMEFDVTNTTASTGSLTNVIGGNWTVARASEGSYFNSSGVWQAGANNFPRITHDYPGGANPRMLIEPQSTNKIRFNYGVSSGSWTKTNVTYTQDNLSTPDGGTNGDELVMAAGGSVSQTITVVASDPYVTSFWAKSISGGTSFRVGTGNTAGEYQDITITTSWAQYFWPSTASSTSEFPQLSNQNGASATIGIWLPGFIEGTDVLSEIITDGTLNASDGYGEIRLADSITNTVPSEGLWMETWIEGTSDGGKSVIPGNTITMVNGTTKMQISKTFDTDAESFIDAVSTLSASEELAINDLVVGLKANGTWSKYDAIYPIIGGTAAEHKWNLKDPRDLDAAFRLTYSGTITHDANGMKGNGTTGYARTWYNTTANWTDDGATMDGAMSFYSNDDVFNDKTDMGLDSSVNISVKLNIQINDGNGSYNGISCAWLGSRGTAGNLKYNVVTATSGAVLTYEDGAVQGASETQTIAGRSANDITIGAGMNDGNATPTSFSARRCAFATIAAVGFTATEISDDYDVIQAFQTALGREVNPLDIFPQDNAAAYLDNVETPGWTASACTKSANTTDNIHGNYCLKGVNTGTGATALLYDLTVVSGNSYTITYWAKRVSGGNNEQQTLGWTGVVTSPTQTYTDSWVEYSHTVEANATTMGMKFYMTVGAANPTGEEIFLDKMRVIDLGVV